MKKAYKKGAERILHMVLGRIMTYTIITLLWSYFILFFLVLQWFPYRYYNSFDRRASCFFRYVLRILGLKVRIHGSIPKDDCIKIIASQHQGGFETIVCFDIFGNSHYVMGNQVLSLPLARSAFMRRQGHVCLTRSNPLIDFSIIRSWSEKIKKSPHKDISIVIFPEGTRIPAGQKGDIKGALFMMKKYFPKAQIYPVTLNSSKVWPGMFTIKGPGTIDITLHKPLSNDLSKEEIKCILRNLYYGEK